MTVPGDVTVINTLSIKNGANAAIARGGDICDAWINTSNHTTRDALPTAVTTLGTLIRTLNDGIVWEVVSVGPVVYAAWSGSGGVTSWNSRTGAVVPVANDYAASQVSNDSSVTGSTVKAALNALLALITALVTGVSSVFGRTGAVVAAVGDYLASQITNNSTVTGAHVSDALDALKAANGMLVFQTLSNLTAFNTTGIANATRASIATPAEIYVLFTAPGSALIAATDAVNVVQPTTISTTRWVRDHLAYSYIADWYIDLTAGNDANDGSVSSQLKTSEELCRRLFPGGQPRVFMQPTTVHVAAGTYGKVYLNVDWPASLTPLGQALFIECAFTSSASMTLTGVVNTVPGTATRGQLTVSSGSFTAKKRIRSTSGANIGATCYSMGQNANAQNHFVSPWFNYITGATVNIANGTTVVVDTLAVSFSEVYVATADPGYVQIDSAILPNGGFFNDVTTNFLVNLVGCEITGGMFGSFAAWQCRTPGDVRCSEGFGFWFGGNVFQAKLSAISGAYLDIGGLGGCAFDGGKLVCGNYAGNAKSVGTTAGIEIETATEWENGIAGNAIFIAPGGFLEILGLQWGASTPYDVGVCLSSATASTTSSAANVAIPATQQLVMAGNNRPYSAIPLSFTRAACTFALISDTTAVSTEANQINQTLATTLAPTTLIASPALGPQYTVKAYLEILVAGTAGKLIMNEIHTGPSGVTQTTPVTGPIDVTFVGNSGEGVVTIVVNGSSAVQVSVTAAPGTFTAGALSYAVRVTATQEPN